MLTLTRYFFRRCLTKPERRVLLLGLDNAGKTSLFNEICRKFGLPPMPIIPTLGQNTAQFTHHGFSFVLTDIGGQSSFRSTWRLYLDVVDAVVFVVDSTSNSRKEEVNEEFRKLLCNDALKGAPICVCANKQDVADAEDVASWMECLRSSPKDEERNVDWTRAVGSVNASCSTGSVKGIDEVIKFLVTSLSEDENAIARSSGLARN